MLVEGREPSGGRDGGSSRRPRTGRAAGSPRVPERRRPRPGTCARASARRSPETAAARVARSTVVLNVDHRSGSASNAAMVWRAACPRRCRSATAVARTTPAWAAAAWLSASPDAARHDTACRPSRSWTSSTRAGSELGRDRTPLDPVTQHLGRDAAEDVLGPGQVGRQPLLLLDQGGGQLASPVDEPGLDAGVGGDVEQLLQQGPSLVGGRPEERGELALRQQHHLAELRQPHPEHLGDDVADLVGPGGDAAPPPAGVLLEHDRRGRLGEPVAALLRPQELRRPGHPEPSRPDAELQAHHRHGVPAGVVAAQRPAGGPGPRHPRVQREAHGVEQAGLAGPGRPVDEEQPVDPDRVEVDGDRARERPERGHVEPVQPHAAPVRRRTARRPAPAASPRARPGGPRARPATPRRPRRTAPRS